MRGGGAFNWESSKGVRARGLLIIDLQAIASRRFHRGNIFAGGTMKILEKGEAAGSRGGRH